MNTLLAALLCLGLLALNAWLFLALQRRREQLEQQSSED